MSAEAISTEVCIEGDFEISHGVELFREIVKSSVDPLELVVDIGVLLLEGVALLFMVCVDLPNGIQLRRLAALSLCFHYGMYRHAPESHVSTNRIPQN